MLRLSYLRPNDLRLNTPQAGNARAWPSRILAGGTVKQQLQMNKNEKVMAVHNSNL